MATKVSEDLANMNNSEYKTYHEAFMANNHGTTAFHTFACIFFTVQCCLFCSITDRHSGLLQYFYEYIIIVLPMIGAHTIFAEYIYLLNFAVFILLVYEFIYQYHNIDVSKRFQQSNSFKTGRVQTVSGVRGLTYMITVFCILAVDFRSFPRNLAKTENYGYSLMDTGVGLFVLISGLVHKDVNKGNIVAVLKSNVKFISVLLFLGVGRFLTVKQLDYQQHVTEYGVHWNFFFTIAVCKLLSSCLLAFSNQAFIFSVIILLIHEYILYLGLEEWVFSDTPRTNFINANREGITSSLGYVSLYLFMTHIRNVILDKTAQRYKVQVRLTVTGIGLWVLTYVVDSYRPTSRTLANAGYCLHIEAILTTIVFVMYFYEALFDNFEIPVILSAANTNGLLYFLLANLMTGVINLNIRTLVVSTHVTFIILNIYMILGIFLIVYLKNRGIKL